MCSAVLNAGVAKEQYIYYYRADLHGDYENIEPNDTLSRTPQFAQEPIRIIRDK